MKLRFTAGLLAAAALLTGCGDPDRTLVGAGTTTVDSGLMAQLGSEFPENVSIVGGSTAEILGLAGQGSLDVVIVHDEAQEQAFLASHPDAERRAVFTSRFLVVGPAALVAQIEAPTPASVFSEIAANGWTFVTRDDGSGTHAREMALWAESGIEPEGEWYLATGQGMGFTLQVTDQRAAFTLVEEGAFLGARDTLSLEAVTFADDSELLNPYSAILVGASGRAFYEWLTGPQGRTAVLLANDEIFGEVIYAPSDDGQ